MTLLTPLRQTVTAAPLSADPLAAYHATGWVSLPGFFSAAEVAAMASWCDMLETRPEKAGEHWLYRQPSLLDASRRVIQRIENFCPFHADFDALARRSRLSDAAGQLLGGEAVLFKEKINFKEPGGEGFKLHQDQQAGWGRYAPLFVTAMVCIDLSTRENGCLEIAAGIDRLDHLIGEEWQPIDEQDCGFAMAALPMAPGDVVFFDSFVPHASKENFTAARRRALFITYNERRFGDVRQAYHDDKHANCPPDIERKPGDDYRFRV